jgi:membrane-associated PAP2 superfamily phosphatase
MQGRFGLDINKEKDNQMNTIVSKPALAGLLLLLALVTGAWLSHSGKPLNGGIFTIHKLIALATVIVIAANVYPLFRSGDIRTFVELAVVAITGLLFLALFVSGALLSIGKPLSGAILRVHQLAPLLALAFSTMTIYLWISSKA